MTRVPSAAVLVAVVCSFSLRTQSQQRTAGVTAAPVSDTMLENPDPADWLMWRRTLNSWGYSPLNQINKSNVGPLRMVWTRGMTAGIQEATPLVHKA